MFFSYLVFTEPGYVALTEVENTTKISLTMNGLEMIGLYGFT